MLTKLSLGIEKIAIKFHNLRILRSEKSKEMRRMKYVRE
jgi:hypothetical protein